MKIILVIILLNFSLLSSVVPFQTSFNNLNIEVDKLGTKLTTQERISLYYMILSIHKKISIAVISDDKSIDIQNIDKAIHKIFISLKNKNSLYSKNEINRLTDSYNKMVEDGFSLIDDSLINQSNEKIIYQDKIIYENPQIDYYRLVTIFTTLGIIIGAIIGYLIVYFKYKKSRKKLNIIGSRDSEIDRLTNDNEILRREIMLINDELLENSISDKKC